MKKNKNHIRNINKKIRPGLTLIEVVVAVIINSIVISGVGILLIGGNRAWQKAYNSANQEIRQDAIVTTLEFSSMGRKSNRLVYTIYKNNESGFLPALPETKEPEEVVSGDAVEFRYWDTTLDSTDSHNLMNTTKTATAYAFFYVDDDKLKVDYGPCPPGAVPEGGGGRNTIGVVTKTLAKNVTVDGSIAGPFSHTTINGIGQGSVRINITLNDPEDNEKIQIMTSTFMRNIWPR